MNKLKLFLQSLSLENGSRIPRGFLGNGSVKFLTVFAAFFMLFTLGIGNAWGDPVVLFHETFGNNSNSARAWSDDYSVKSGVSAVYSGITGYTVSNAKQGKNTTGSTASGLNQSTSGTDAYIIIGPLAVDNYESLGVTYQWKAGSTKGTYTTSLYYATSSTGSYTEVSGTGTGATGFVERSYNLPEAAQVSTLYLKIVWNTSNTQGIIDEVELTGTASGDNPGPEEPSVCADPEFSLAAGSYEGAQSVEITCSTDDATIYYTTDGSDPTTSSAVYSTAIPVTANTTIKAYAVKADLDDSQIVEAAYTITAGPDVTLDFTSNDGWDFPTSSKVVTETSYTKGDYTIKVAGSEGQGFLYQTNDNNLMVGKNGAYLTLPTFDRPITKIVVVGFANGSGSVGFNVYQGETAVSTAVTSCKVDQTFEIAEAKQKADVAHSIKITTTDNIRFSKIKIYLGAAPEKYAVTLAADGGTLTATKGGNAFASGTEVVAGTELVMTATPDETHTTPSSIVVTKTVGGDDVTSTVYDSENNKITVPEYAITVSASFVPTYAINIVAENGSIAITDGDNPITGRVVAGTTISATATANTGYDFVSLAVSNNVENPTIDANEALFDMPDGDVTITATFALQQTATIIIKDDVNELDFGEVPQGESAVRKFSVSAHHLNASKVTLTSSNPVFAVSPAELTVSEGAIAETEITITSSNEADADDYIETITISDGAEGATDKEISLLMTVLPKYTAKWYVNGSELTESSMTAVEGTDLVFPDELEATGNCQGLVFKGWLTSELDEASATEPAGLITSYDNITMPENGVSYYAVFAEEVPGAEVTNTYSHTITSSTWSANGSQTLSDVSWTLATGSNYFGYDGTNGKGQQVGSGSDAASTLSLSTSGISGKITSVKIYTSGAKDINATVAASVNGVAYKNDNSTSPVAISTTNTGYEFTGSETGEIVISWAQISSKAIYFKQIEVKYATPGAPTYSNYVTTCVACSRVTLNAEEVEHGSIKLQQDSKDVTSVKTCDAAQTVNVVATPDDGYELTGVNLNGFEGASYNNEVISINQNASGTLTATATFTLVDYAITYTAPTNGTYTVKVGEADAVNANTVANLGQTITLAAEAAEGYRFTGWTVRKANNAVVTVENNAFTMPAEAVTVAANFARVYSVADFIAIQDKGTATYCIEGIVSAITTAYSSEHKNITYTISDDGLTSSTNLSCYRGIKGDNFEISDLAVGDKVIVCGSWNSSHSNLDAANYLIYRQNGQHASYEIAGELSKTAFSEGDKWLDSYMSNLSLNNVYNTGYKVAVSGVTFSANKTDQETLAATDTKITVTATKEGITPSPTKEFDITVSSATVVSIVLKDDDNEYETKTIYYVGQAFVAPKVMATLSDNSVIEVPATLKDVEGNFDNTINGVGQQTVVVEYIRSDREGDKAETSYQITMKKIFDNANAPHNVADATALIIASAYQSTTSSTDYMWVRGKVASNPDNKGTYTISDDGTSANVLTIWYGKYFTSTENANVAVGDEVVLKGTIVNYNGTKAELTSSTVVSQLRAGTLAIADVAELESGQELAEANLTINRNGSTGAITFSCEDNEALEIVDNKLRAKGEATVDVEVTATMAAVNTEGAINFTEASITFTVHVIPAQVRYAVTFDMNGGSADSEMSLGDQLENANVVIPAGIFTKDGYKFNGWTVVAGETPVDVTKTGEVYSFAMPAAAVTVTAQWVEGSEANWVAATWASANNITSNTNLEGNYATIDADANISLTWNKASGNNVPAYNSNNKEARLYQNTTLQIAAVEGKLIKKVTFTFTSGNTGTLSANVGTYSSSVWTGLANVITFTNTGNAAYIKSINIEYLNGTVTTLNIENVSLMLSAGTKNLSISCNINPTPTISFEIAEADQAIATVADGVVTANAIGGPIYVTARIAQGENYTEAVANFTITVTDKTPTEMSFPEESYDANLGSDFAEPILTTDPENLTVAYSSSVEAVATVDASTGAITLVGEGTTVITATFAGNDDYAGNTATYTLNVIDPNKDVLTASAIEAGSSYTDWSNKTFGSGVKYAGNSRTGAGENAGAIQMRVQNPSGIVTTTAKGYLKSISATETSNGTNTLEIYAKGTAYESSADLYSSDASVKGVKIGTIGADGGAMTFVTEKQELAYDGNYKYIGIKANGGAVYYDNITITWTPAEFESFDVTYQPGEVTAEPVVQSVEDGSVISLAVANTFAAPEGKIFAGWLKDGEENVREAGSNYTVTEAVTFVAQWISVYTITYKPGEAEGENVTIENVQAGNYQLADNTFTAPTNKEFAGWKLNNEGDLLAAGADYNVIGNAEFTAQWSVIKQDAGLAYATTSYSIIRGTAFEAPTLTNDHNLDVTYSGNNDAVATIDATTGAITLQGVVGTVTVTAMSEATEYYYAGEASYTLQVKDANLVGGWKRLTSSNTLEEGMNVIIAQHVSTGSDIKTMGGQNTNNRSAVAGELESDVLAAHESTEILTLVAVSAGTFAFKTADGKYLYAASSSNNYLKSQSTIDDNATWAISLSADGKATITAQGQNTRNLMRYNSTNGIFSCYANGQNDVAIYSKTVSISGETEASTLDDYADVIVEENSTLTVDAAKPLGQVTIKNGAAIEVEATTTAESLNVEDGATVTLNADVTTPVFHIAATQGTSSGQVVVGSNAVTATQAVFEMTFDETAVSEGWYAFTVPFPVNTETGVYNAKTNTPLVNETDYAIMTYHGAIRAQGLYGWKKYHGNMIPGVLYIITFADTEYNKIAFHMADGSSVMNGNTVTLNKYAASSDNDNGWNGIGNPTLCYATNNTTVISGYKAQFLNHDANAFEVSTEDIVNERYTVGSAFFVKAGSDLFPDGDTKTIPMEHAVGGDVHAPARAGESTGEFLVRLGKTADSYEDQLFVSASEDATATYQDGHELVKMGSMGAAKVARMYVDAYGLQLCDAEFPLENQQALFPLVMTTPAAGTYHLYVERAVEGADLYVTYNGAIVWNLSLGDYELDLTRGTTTGYGLLLVVQPNQMPTGVENGELLNGENGVQKILLNGQLYILRDGHLYDAVGKEMK